MFIECLIYPALMTIAMLSLALLGLFLFLQVFFGVNLWEILRKENS